MSNKKRAVVVSTAHRGIFVGYTTDDPGSEIMTLTDAHMIVYHSSDSHGFVGIGVNGPGNGARVSPAVSRITLRNITADMDASSEAVEAWRSAPWK